MSAINRCLPPPTSRAAPPDLWSSLLLSLISEHRMPTRLKVLSAWPTEGSTATSDAYLIAEPLLGFGGDEQTVGTWVTRRPTAHADVPTKLTPIPTPPNDTRSSGPSSAATAGLQAQLEPGDDNPFPVAAPTLLAGMSHVGWPAGSRTEAP